MNANARHMRLGAFLLASGNHPAAWRHPDVASDFGTNIEAYVEAVQVAERGLFDMMFLADTPAVIDDDVAANGRSSRVGYFEPITLLSALAMATSRIGLVATMSSSFNEAYNVARKFASLDHISHGRAGWNMVTSGMMAEARNFGLDVLPEHQARYERGEEFTEVVLGLWDSWEDGAFTYDKASGQFYDPTKLHTLNHEGRFFKVRGPLNVPRTPQGRPILVQAGSSAAGIELAAKMAEVVFTAQSDIEDAKTFYATLKGKLGSYGRAPNGLLIMPGFSPVVGATEDEAKAKLRAVQELLHPAVGIAMLSSMVGFDLSPYPLDGPVPEMPETSAHKSRQALVLEVARRDNLTIRELYLRVAGTRGHNLVVGTPETIADRMEQWFLEGAADGFNIMPLTLPGGISDFVTMVVPELQRRGLYRTGYEGTTLRENLGLPWPRRIMGGSA